MLLSEAGSITIVISEQGVAETERTIARKVPRALPDARRAVLHSKARIVKDPVPEQVAQYLSMISDPADVPILVAALLAQVDYLVTLNRKHFIDDPEVSRRSGLRIGLPGEALAWVRERLPE